MENITVGMLIEALQKVENKDLAVALYDERLDNFYYLKNIPDTVEITSAGVDLNFHSEEDSQDSEKKLSTLELDFTYDNVYDTVMKEHPSATVEQIEAVCDNIKVDTKRITRSIILQEYTDYKYITRNK
jgi:hypothetical protein